MLAPSRDVWQPRALCCGNHSHLFFPPSAFERKDERERREARARAICKVCPVREECLRAALDIKEPYGIWGGLTEGERREFVLRSV
ncbi:putative transcriptional regulator WhiB3 [bacterium BMS3Abin02]|nr:WhiB family transcriptional regulator [Actinomycetota bacterium]GBD85060.1 putative transcriptional regulator WhiB3 [bacterium BMS3Abin02]GBE23051.1 putative transcriptional regulator WhiB3 [bacterium BMS3Bbin01]HDH27111.1 WhiB family transcriptional regulator [Actinomycetota bacterium]HDK44768.1 WhiB family transcriptional regulator [Actinomycetota bacterium]